MGVRLHVNVDHVATLRQARGVEYPSPARAAMLVELAGADGITIHLREDRRHIHDQDVRVMRATVATMLNLEMAATAEMVQIACDVRPDLVTLVPEKREERTTEGGLDVVAHARALAPIVNRLAEVAVPVSLFIDPDPDQVRASIDLGVAAIELHTGDYANARAAEGVATELGRLAEAARFAGREAPALRVAAGHGLTVANVVALVARVPGIVELNIGHALVADAIFVGLEGAVARFREAIDRGERGRGRADASTSGESR
jgi:pyridoxine 5-phosphate synthase